MNWSTDVQLQLIQQQIHQHLMGSGYNNMPSPEQYQKRASEPIVVDESDDEDDEQQRTLFIANLDDRVTEELLYEVFLQAGPIERARIPKDNNGRQRTYGFITYNSKCTAPYAMHLFQGLSLYRKTLTIKYKGRNMLPPLKTPDFSSSGGKSSNSRQSYDNSSLRSGNFSSYNDNTRMMDSNTSPSGSSRHQERLSKHASNQMRPHSNSSPYQRNSSNNHDKWRQNNNNGSHKNSNNRYSDSSSNSNHNNNNKSGNNRYSDHRGGKYRR
ncbi:RNA-binding protein 7 [Musca domestica]|uniref:RNA-binding protein 7 n=1 Tax=Musca domestica TaxID=7370 RepID=A0A1I8NHW3_MUSDO|nr:RNA-binding protein 7 [Musca domestica]